MLTEMSHLKKVFVDADTFEIYKQMAGHSEYKPKEKETIMRALREVDVQHMRSPHHKKKRLHLDEVNVANLNENAEALLNTLQQAKEVQGPSISADLLKKQNENKFVNAIDYSRCLFHQKEYLFMDKDTLAFYCAECITDINITINKSNLVKLKKESNLIREKSREAVINMSRLKAKIENNLKNIHFRMSTDMKLKQEIKSVVSYRVQALYAELKVFEQRYAEKIAHEIDLDLRELKFQEFKHLKLIGLVSAPLFNMNHAKDSEDIIANICKWRKVSQEVYVEDFSSKFIENVIEEKIKVDYTNILNEIKGLKAQVAKETYTKLLNTANHAEEEREIARGNFVITKEIMLRELNSSNNPQGQQSSKSLSRKPSRQDVGSGRQNNIYIDGADGEPVKPIVLQKNTSTGKLEVRQSKDGKGFTPNTKTPGTAKMTKQGPSKSLANFSPFAEKGGKKSLIAPGESKFFSNIFGTIAAINYFEDEDNRRQEKSPQKTQKGTESPGKGKNQGGSNIKALTYLDSEDPSSIKKKVRSPSPLKTMRASFAEDDFFQNPNSLVVSRENFVDLLLKNSEICRKFAQLRQYLLSVVIAIPMTALGISSLRPIFKLSAIKGGVLNSSLFHKMCDGQGPYLGFVHHSQGMFGFFVENDFMDDFEVYSRAENNFIFVLQSPLLQKMTIFRVKRGKENFALCNTEEGFCLGMPTPHNRDLYMNFDDLSKCSSKIGFAYEAGDNDPSCVAGKYNSWNIHEIEILQLMTKNKK